MSIAVGIALFCILAKQIPVLLGSRLQNAGGLAFWNDFIDYRMTKLLSHDITAAADVAAQ